MFCAVSVTPLDQDIYLTLLFVVNDAMNIEKLRDLKIRLANEMRSAGRNH